MKTLIYLHIATILPVLILGPFVIFRTPKDKVHKILGKIWALLMITSCLLTFGVRHNGGFSWLHGLSLYTLYSVISALLSIRKKQIHRHKQSMIGSYIGTVIAFIFAMTPDRLLGNWIQSVFN